MIWFFHIFFNFILFCFYSFTLILNLILYFLKNIIYVNFSIV